MYEKHTHINTYTLKNHLIYIIIIFLNFLKKYKRIFFLLKIWLEKFIKEYNFEFRWMFDIRVYLKNEKNKAET